MKKIAVASFYSHPLVRVITLAAFAWFLFRPLDVLFFFIFILNIPHFAISIYRRSRTREVVPTIFWLNEALIFGVGLALAFFKVEWLYYLAFVRFMLHFFEDGFFNLEFHDVGLGILITGLFLSTESLTMPMWPRLVLAVIGIGYFVYRTPKRRWVEGLNFYPMMLLLFFVPWALGMTFNSSQWGYGVGILHTLLWMTWDGFEKDFSFKRMVTSQSFVLTMIFALSVTLIHFYLGHGLQTFMRHGMIVFYLCLFAHVYSKDTYKLLATGFPLKN